MKQLIILIVALIFSLQGAMAQTGLEISLNPNVSTFDLDNVSKLDVGAGLGVNYFIKKKIGLSFNMGTLANQQGFDGALPNFDFNPIGDPLNSNWKMNFFSLGPIIRLGNKFHFDIIPQIGIGKINNPSTQLFFNDNGVIVPISEQGKTKKSGISMIHNLGASLGYNISDKLTVKLNCNFMGDVLSGTGEYFTNTREFVDADNSGMISQDELKNSNYVQDLCSGYTPIVAGVGIAFKLGNKSKNKKQRDLKNERNILPNARKNNNSNRSSCGVDIIADTLWCADPFYNQTTNQYTYKGRITVKVSNSSGRRMVLARPGSGPGYDHKNIFTSSVGAIAVDGHYTNPTTCFAPINWKLALLNNTTQTFCITYTSPTNGGMFNPITSVYDDVYGAADPTVAGSCSALSDPYAMNVPDCKCTNCDSVNLRVDTTSMIFANRNFIGPNGVLFSSGQLSYARLLAQTPIRKITAEIVHYRHRAEKDACYTCNKENFMNGHFLNRNIASNVINNYLHTRFVSKQGKITGGINYGNQVSWTANDQVAGVDISGGINLKLDIAFPALLDLECCSDTIETCIRYRVTDINCNTCEVVKCYSGTRRYADLPVIGTGGGKANGGIGTTIPKIGTNGK